MLRLQSFQLQDVVGEPRAAGEVGWGGGDDAGGLLGEGAEVDFWGGSRGGGFGFCCVGACAEGVEGCSGGLEGGFWEG